MSGSKITQPIEQLFSILDIGTTRQQKAEILAFFLDHLETCAINYSLPEVAHFISVASLAAKDNLVVGETGGALQRQNGGTFETSTLN